MITTTLAVPRVNHVLNTLSRQDYFSTLLMEVMAPTLPHCDWIASLDADEFLLPEPPETLQQVLGRMSPRIGSVLVNWAVYGGNGQREYRPGSPPHRFARRTDRTREANELVKPIFRPKAFLHFRNPHIPVCKEGYWPVRPDGTRVALPEAGGRITPVVWDRLRINHYIVKSWDEFADRKRSRYRDLQRSTKISPLFFRRHDQDTVLDPPDDRMLDAARACSAALRERLLASGHGDVLARAETPVPRPTRVMGAVEVVRDLGDGMLEVEGWAVDGRRFAAPYDVVLDVAGRVFDQLRPEIVVRPDLTKAHGYHPACGFRVLIPAPQNGAQSPVTFVGFGPRWQ